MSGRLGQFETVTYPANADLSTKQFYGVSPASGGKVALCASATATAQFGILQNKPAAANEAAEICVFGPTKAKLAGTTAVGDKLGMDANGKLAVVTADKARYCATAMEAGVADDVAEIFFEGDRFLAA